MKGFVTLPITRSRRSGGLGPLAIAACLLAGSAGISQAQQPVPFTPLIIEQFAFDTADTNADGVVSEAELARDAAHGFATLDKNGDRKLTPDELAPHDSALFKKVDANGDGVLTFDEVMANKLRALQAGDKNKDGGLNFNEMVTIVETESGAAP
jgi:Ca2+-binding EF-hand superfamily protein